MVLPTPAVLFWAWFILTPLIRIGLRMFVHNLGSNARLLVAHLSALGIILVATAITLSAEELAGMAVMFAIGQAAFFVLDFVRMRPES